MRRLLSMLTVVLLLVAAVAWARAVPQGATAQNGVKIEVGAANPWTHLRLNNVPDDFHFAVLSDRTGAARPGIFERCVAQLNLLQPQFVLTVGDLIEGQEANDPEAARAVRQEWDEFDGIVKKLQMPFFYLLGNHDMRTPTMAEIWDKRFGKRYYSFVYRGVLFLMLNSEGPPNFERGQIGAEQRRWIAQTLKDAGEIRWTIVLLHRPIWRQSNSPQSGWLEVEEILKDRPYTVFVGHIHEYQKYVRNGRNYYQLATSGGGSKLRGVPHGQFDHCAWVTMKKDGPLIANVLLEGVYNDNLSDYVPKLQPTKPD